jgi:hypothetical protein
MNLRKDRRKQKRWFNTASKKLGKYGYFIDCNYLPCRVIEMELYTKDFDGDLEGVCLTDNWFTSCSIRHCGPEPITEKTAFEFKDYLETHTWAEYLLNKMKFDQDSVDVYMEQDKSSHFHKGGIDNDRITVRYSMNVNKQEESKNDTYPDS